MGFLNIFAGKSPEAHEQKGDSCFATGAFGDARLEFEKALHKIRDKFPEKKHLGKRIHEKYLKASEALALAHVENAQILARAGETNEAAELYGLAMDLSQSRSTREKIEKGLKSLSENNVSEDGYKGFKIDFPEPGVDGLNDEDGFDSDDQELFSVLCNALSDETADIYQSLGKTFAMGYIALNQGDFPSAIKHLSAAMEENSQHAPLISLELATAFLHAEQHDRSEKLLEDFLQKDPYGIRAYQLLSELYWEKERFADAKSLLAAAPRELRKDFSMQMLLGETFFQAGDYAKALEIFQACQDLHGSNDVITRALAKTLEASGQTEQARDMYANLMNQCVSCGRNIDPFVKNRFAELCFQTGETSTKLLDLFFSLVQEDPGNRGVYYTRIGRVYEKRGEASHADRYLSLARQMGQKV